MNVSGTKKCGHRVHDRFNQVMTVREGTGQTLFRVFLMGSSIISFSEFKNAIKKLGLTYI